MNLSIELTRRSRKRKQKDGRTIIQDRYVLNFRDPKTGQRHQLFFEKRNDAVARRDAIYGEYQRGVSLSRECAGLTVAEAVNHWLENRKGQITPVTYNNYRGAVRYIVGPIIKGSHQERIAYRRDGCKAPGVELLHVMGHYRIRELMTADIRAWHRVIAAEVGMYTANRAKMLLASALRLADEDFNVRPPSMPTNIGRGRKKKKKEILSPQQVALVLSAAQKDSERGIYYAFPFLTGVRPAEQLALLWKEVDFERNVVRIVRTQIGNELVEATKTEASVREVPMCDLLRRMLLEWRVRCPRRDGELHRVFPGLGNPQTWPLPRTGGGGVLLYRNFNRRFWTNPLKRIGVPHVTPHSARHTFISTLQAQGIEVGLVAKLVGHADPNVTLGHYTRAVRGGEGAVAALETAFKAG